MTTYNNPETLVFFLVPRTRLLAFFFSPSLATHAVELGRHKSHRSPTGFHVSMGSWRGGYHTHPVSFMASYCCSRPVTPTPRASPCRVSGPMEATVVTWVWSEFPPPLFPMGPGIGSRRRTPFPHVSFLLVAIYLYLLVFRFSFISNTLLHTTFSFSHS